MKPILAPEMHARAQERALQIFNLETKVNDALSSAASLLASLAQDGRDAGVHLSADQKLISSTIALAEALNGARRCSIDVHDKAAAIAKTFGIAITAGDPGVKAPSDAQAGLPMMRVVVGSEAA